MHQIGVVGLSYRHVGVDEVARFSVPKADIAEKLPALRDSLGVAEIFYVGTCNRVEVLYATADGIPAGDARQEVFRALKFDQAYRFLRAQSMRRFTGRMLLGGDGIGFGAAPLPKNAADTSRTHDVQRQETRGERWLAPAPTPHSRC